MAEIKIYHESDVDLAVLNNKTIAFIGYGNQAKAQALNMRDSGLNVVVGNINDEYKIRAEKDKFQTFSIPDVISKADFLFLLIPDDLMKDIFNSQILPNLKKEHTLVFTSGYYIAFDIIKPPTHNDVLLISPRLLGEGVRERFLNKKGFFSFIGIHQDSSGNSKKNLLALTKAIGGLSKAGLELTFKQQTVLNMFTEQAFFPAFDQVLIRSITNLVKSGYPPEAIFVELILSEEGSFTVDKMIDYGLLKQMNFHSQTSQYGSLSRGAKFQKLASKIMELQQEILNDLEKGRFSEEWEDELSDIKLKAMKYYAFNTNFNELESTTRKNLKFPEIDVSDEAEPISEELVKKNQELGEFTSNYKKFYRQF